MRKKKREIINQTTALWMRNSSNISSKEYKDFYMHLSHQSEEPWLVIHNKIEGIDINYVNLLFVPKNKPFDLFNNDRKSRVKLYINRVFISDKNTYLLPTYLRFLYGIIDSSDLPLNISRETLQNNHIIIKIRNIIVKKVLSKLSEVAAVKSIEYLSFLKNFGEILKEGLCNNTIDEEKESILSLCRFKNTESDTFISLDHYIANMSSKQSVIYYLTGDSISSMQKKPPVRGL